MAAEGKGIRDARGRRLGGVALGTVLATLVAWSPGAVQPVLAAGPLQIGAETTYTVDAADGRVHVAIDYTITNNKPNTATVVYYYRSVSIGVQADARAVRASDRSGGLGVSTVRHRLFTEVEVRLRANLYYHRTTTFTVRFDLVGAKPRSETPTRVGRAFVTFAAWAFGDPDQGAVEVRMPPGFATTVEGDAMTTANGSGGAVLRASPPDPESFFAIVSGESRDAFEEERLSLPGGADVVVLSWPEDDIWADTVSDTLEAGIPKLQDLVGLDWPVSRDLRVRERYTPALEGYAGIFFTDDERIDVSEELDPVTILHEASHAWFNEHLFTARWIYEGLAEDYAWRVESGLGGEKVPVPDEPDKADKGAVDLNTWTFPAVIRDDTNATEVYGYEASFWLMHLIVESAGVDQMRKAFASADANLTAYPGEGTPETVAAADDWRRFLDLTQPVEEPDPAPVMDALAEYVLGGAPTEVRDRHDAREAYRELIAAGDGWLPPWYVREPMSTWRFRDATPRIAAATSVLALRDQVVAAASAGGLAFDDDQLEATYEEATDGFEAATSLASRELEAVRAIADAEAAVGTAYDFVAQVGRLGEPDPSVAYQAARAAFEAGDVTGAIEQAGTAAMIVVRAPLLGQERLIMGSVGMAALVGVLFFVVIARRRRTQQSSGVEPGSAGLLALDARFAPGPPQVAASDAPDAPDSPDSRDSDSNPEAIEPHGTLGGHSGSPPTPLGEGSSDVEGGTTRT